MRRPIFAAPVRFLPLTLQGEACRMAYIDAAPVSPANGRSVVLLHGKNFYGEYWAETVSLLTHNGYRAIVPDQIGFGKSSKPDLAYSFDLLADNTAALLDFLKVERAAIVGHSMGGMLAVRFVRGHPDRASQLVLENPIGLEDYRLAGVPFRATDLLVEDEMRQTVAQIRAYRKAYFVRWLPAYERFVEAPARMRLSGEYPRYARSAALTSQMIYQQPVRSEFRQITVPTTLIIGQQDRTAIGRDRVTDPRIKAALGDFPALGRAAARDIPGAKLVEIPGCGHIPHIEAPAAFHAALLSALKTV
ncbi:MAG: alpha/beta hydrolase [Cytophagales bacterium]|nr:alpha/beta hydrolase [Armatimonadota bacterium]